MEVVVTETKGQNFHCKNDIFVLPSVTLAFGRLEIHVQRKYQSDLLVKNTDSSREFLLLDSDTDTSNSVGRLEFNNFVFQKIYVQEASKNSFFNPIFNIKIHNFQSFNGNKANTQKVKNFALLGALAT